MSADRASYVAGLRALADLLEHHDDLPLPHDGSATEISFYFLSSQDPKADLARFARIIPGAFRKDVWGGDTNDEYFDLRGAIEGLKIRASAYRAKVCTRVVVGTREVTKEIPDPTALAAVPTVAVTETVEDVEWDCGPILTARTREQEMVDAQNDGFLDNADPDMDAAGTDDYLSDVPA